MLAALDIGANPSSVHGAGRKARQCLENARRQVAGAIGGIAQDLVFTSGGTEANALALLGLARKLDGRATLLMSGVEHSAVKDNADLTGIPLREVPVRGMGMIDLDGLKTILSELTEADGMPVLALMLANNETGVIQPVAEAAAMMREAGGLTHCDAVQALGKIQVNVNLLGVDYLALSAHKCGGPTGVGALWMRQGAPLVPPMRGGGQERSLRSGTENLPGIAAFGAAAEVAVSDMANMQALALLRDAMEKQVKAAGAHVFGEKAARLPNTSCFALEGLASETQVMAMDLEGVCISAGSACSSGKVKTSGVLTAMGAEEALAGSAIRVSFGWNTENDEPQQVGKTWLKVANRIKG